ncbi:MAG: hypothetical protein EAX95_16645, partial [Candidatus Thorarchaeota archaeon]|nr:hypothetical protein [Candidatus Thorarchaeota archaeon]
VLFSILVAVFVPLITYGLITSLQTGESSTEMERSRLGRITKITRLVRWDAALLLIGSLILVSLGFGRVDVRNSPILTIVLSFLPAVFFVAAASLARKALSKFPNLLSKVFAFFFAFQSAKLGIRRFGRNAKSTIILVLLFSATLTLTISSATVANSMPITQLNHARFAIGSDVTFHLSKSKYSSWPDFIGNVTENEHVEALAQVSVGTVYLSEGRHGGVPFIAATPSSFINVGYDENGNRLSESYMGQLLMELNSSQSSAIITEDVASDYDLKQGDLLRSFALGEEDETMEFEILAIIPVLPAPMIPSSTSLDSNDIVGRMRVWFNIDTVPTEISLIDWTDTYLCLRVEESANGTMVAEEILSEWENDILHLGEWASVCHELDTYLERESFNLDLAVDTLVLTTSYVFIIVALIINEISRRRAQERENALLRSMGASSYDLAKSNLMEATGFVIYGLLLVALLCPLLVSNSLEIALNAYPAWNFDFYIQVFPTIPWTLVLSLSMLASFVTYASYAASAFISQSIDFSDALDAKWADYPYGGVMA